MTLIGYWKVDGVSIETERPTRYRKDLALEVAPTIPRVPGSIARRFLDNAVAQ